MKGLLLITSLASVWLVWSSAGLLGRHRLGAALFLGLNPIVLVWGLGGDHNDFLMIFLITLAMYVLIQARVRRAARVDALESQPAVTAQLTSATARLRAGALRALAWLDGGPRRLRQGEPGWWWEVAAGIALAGAVAIKASCVILVPVVLAGSARRLRLGAGLILGFVGLGAATLVAFGPNLPDLSQQDSLVIPTGIPNLTGYILGIGGDTSLLRSVFTLMLVLAVVACTVWAWRSHDWLMPCAVVTFALLLSLSWELPWYLVWLLPFAALARRRQIRVAAIVLGVYVFLSWMPYATTFDRDLGLHPQTTIVGRTDARFLHLLLYG
jgi:alpha-1,6-mannosyltransferase